MINLNSLFGSRQPYSLKDFIAKLKEGNRDFFEILNIPEDTFEEASFEELLSNESDVLSGVNRVQKNFSNRVFNCFDGCLIKHHDNEEVKLVLYTTTSNTKAILGIADTFFEELGPGFRDNERFVSFCDETAVHELSTGTYHRSFDIMHIWLHDDLSILLQYKPQPFQQLSLMVSVIPQKKLDTTIRRNGTVLDLVDVNINEVLLQSEVEGNEQYNDYGTKYTDYIVQLTEPIAFSLDIVKVRLFGDNNFFNEHVQTHVKFMSSKPLKTEDKVSLVEKLYKIYGNDDLGSGELEFHEREMLDESAFWVGRKWTFNTLHSLWDMDNPDESFAYCVTVDDHNDEEGFKLHVMCYNEIIRLFRAS